MGSLGSEGPPVFCHKLVGREAFALCGLTDCVPDAALVDVNLSGLRKVQFLAPGVAVVEGELDLASYAIPAPLVLFRIVEVGPGEVAHDDCPLQYPL